MLRKSVPLPLLAALAVVLAVAPPASAGPFDATAPVDISAGDPFATCPPDGSGTNFADAEVEPFVDVNPTNAQNIVAIYQQDRYSNGGAKGTVASVSMNGGTSWTQVAVPADIRCAGGRFQRGTDPWVSFSPDGTLHAMTLSIDPDPPTGGFGANAMVYNRSTDGGLTWEDPIILREDHDLNFLNDKNSMTADPNDSDFVYAVWDRLQEPSRAQHATDNPIGLGFKGPIWFTRSTNGGDSWEPARSIYETGANKQTIGNQIVVRPQGELFDFFGDIVNRSRRRGGIGPILISYIVSGDNGASWSRPKSIDDQLPMSLFRRDSTIDTEAFPCPEPSLTTRCPIRSGDFIPEVAVDSSNGNLYAVWMDARFSFIQTGSFQWDSIAFSQSTNGGRSWSAPIQVNKTPGGSVQNSQAFTPSVDVNDDGTVTVTSYDFRDNTANPSTLLARQFAVHCHAASENCANAASWNEETPVGTPFDIRNTPFAGGYFLGDYMGLASDGSDFVSVFGQGTAGSSSSQFFSRLSPAP